MPGGKSANLYEGDKGEFLAQYLLSFIGLPLPVLRQLDIGIDFYCNISDGGVPLLSFTDYFSLQVKKVNSKTGELSQRITFGGHNDNKTVWKEYEIKWLFSQSIPFYLGIVDVIKSELKIYSTSTIWFIYHRYPNAFEIELKPRLDITKTEIVHDPKDIAELALPEQCFGSDGKTYQVDLGPPIETIRIEDCHNEDRIDQIKRRLISEINLIDKRNLMQRDIGSPFLWWNRQSIAGTIGWATYGSPRFSPDTIYDILVPALSPLALYFKSNGDIEKFNRVRKVMDIFSEKVPPEIIAMLDQDSDNI